MRWNYLAKGESYEKCITNPHPSATATIGRDRRLCPASVPRERGAVGTLHRLCAAYLQNQRVRLCTNARLWFSEPAGGLLHGSATDDGVAGSACESASD